MQENGKKIESLATEARSDSKFTSYQTTWATKANVGREWNNRQMGNKPKVIDEDTGKGFIDFVREQGDIEGAAKLQKVEDEIKAAIEAATAAGRGGEKENLDYVVLVANN